MLDAIVQAIAASAPAVIGYFGYIRRRDAKRIAVLEAREDRCSEKLVMLETHSRLLTEEIDQLLPIILEGVAEKLIGVVECDDTGIITRVNRPFLALFKWHVDDLIGENIMRLVPYAKRQTHAVYFRRWAAERRQPRSDAVNVSILAKDDREYACSVNLTGWEDDGRWCLRAEIRFISGPTERRIATERRVV